MRALEIIREMEEIIVGRFREIQARVEELHLRGLMDVEALREYSRLRKALEWVGDRYFELGGGRPILADRLRLNGGMRVLDVGSGDGWFSIQAGYLHRDVEFHGVELSEEYAEAREYAEIFGLENVHFYYLDAYETPFPDEAFDRVALFFSLSNIARGGVEASRLFRECRRVLRRDGLLGVAEPLLEDFPESLQPLLLRLYETSGMGESLLGRGEVLRAMEEAGLKPLSLEVVEPPEAGAPMDEAEAYLRSYYGCPPPMEELGRLKLSRVWVRDDPPSYHIIIARPKRS